MQNNQHGQIDTALADIRKMMDAYHKMYNHTGGWSPSVDQFSQELRDLERFGDTRFSRFGNQLPNIIQNVKDLHNHPFEFSYLYLADPKMFLSDGQPTFG